MDSEIEPVSEINRKVKVEPKTQKDRLDRLVELVSSNPQEEIKSEKEEGFVKVDDDDKGSSVDTEEMQNSLQQHAYDRVDGDDDSVLNTEVVKNVIKKVQQESESGRNL